MARTPQMPGVRARNTRRTRGFTLVELLVVVGIIAILASAGIPNFIRLVYKSRRVEAYQSLKAIHATQVQFQAETGVYADTFAELGFEIEGAEVIDERTIMAPYYTYTMSALDVGDDARQNYRAIATGDIDPSDPVLDILMIENQLTIVEGG